MKSFINLLLDFALIAILCACFPKLASAETFSISINTTNVGLTVQCGSAATGHVGGLSFTSGQQGALDCSSVGSYEISPITGQLVFHEKWGATYGSGGSISYSYFDGTATHLLTGYMIDGSSYTESWDPIFIQYFRDSFRITEDSLNAYTGSGFFELNSPCHPCAGGSNGFASLTLTTPEPGTIYLGVAGLSAICFRVIRRRIPGRSRKLRLAMLLMQD
jgi:hypothetical protein